MSPLRILISGAGISGPVLAFFLARSGVQVTIVEKSPSLRAGGQNVDVRGVGLQVIRRMGLEAAVLRKTTQEEGVAFVDAADRRWAEFPVRGDGGVSMTAEVEIMRGALAEILYEATREDVRYVFGSSISSMEERDDKVCVSFKKENQDHSSSHQDEECFDLVVAADGLGSPTRALILRDDNPGPSPIKSLDQYVAWFSIPHHETDGRWARWYNAPGRRMILLRPDTQPSSSDPSTQTPQQQPPKLTRASLWICSTSSQLRNYSALTPAAQKALMRSLFADAGWEAPRVLAGMDTAADFYMQEVAQVKIPDSSPSPSSSSSSPASPSLSSSSSSFWSRGRTVLVGDAASCPSPISGMGTTVAIVGAYVLAGEISRSQRDPERAFDAYERRMRPFVERAQKLIPGAPALANPDTRMGIWVMNAVLGLVAWTMKVGAAVGVPRVLGRWVGPPVEAMVLPEYEEMGGEGLGKL